MTQPVRVLGFAGSLRKASYNRSLLYAATELAPEGMTIESFDLAGIPLYNGDVEAAGDPESVAAFKAAIRSADGLLVATPEYNHGMPGVLKNAIDWASRPSASAPLSGKPAGVIGAARGVLGTARAQGQARLVLASTNCFVLPQPQILVGESPRKFDEAGKLTDQTTREHLQKYLATLHAWVARFKNG